MRQLLMVLVMLFAMTGVHAESGKPVAQTVLHLLDYISVDYPEAVENGRVKHADEFREMSEFAAQVAERVRGLPENAARPRLGAGALVLEQLIQARADPARVAESAGRLKWDLIAAYGLSLTPRALPDPARGRSLYAQNCATCHGVSGYGDGPAAKELDPSPANFHDTRRMAQRSVYALYNTITLGLTGTSMASFDRFTEEDRWALAFFTSALGVPDARVAAGEKLWKTGAWHRIFPDFENVVTLSETELIARHGEPAATVQTHLRAHPEALAAHRPAPIVLARTTMAAAHAAYGRGDHRAARDLAITAYLEGFELVEAALANVDAALMHETETRMIALRSAIQGDTPAREVNEAFARVDALLLAGAEKLGDGRLSPEAAFSSAFLILLREGLEAILVLAAIFAFVAKTGRRDAMPWVHGGWIAALLLGAVTWLVASFAIDISGANRELTEGLTALLASAMLLYVGYWLHGKSHAEAWNRFIRDQVGQALARKTLWAMAGVSFLAVYREVFEIVLFYQALWAQADEGGSGPMFAGVAAAALALAAIGYAILKSSVRLPIGPFFSVMSALLAVLAIVFAGHGVAALQEAGLIGISALALPALPILGIHPSMEGIGTQLVVGGLVALCFRVARRQAKAG